MSADHVHAVVLAGGSGTRFWPLSRHHRPKQFIPLLGGEQTTFGATIDRLEPLIPRSRCLVMTNRDHVELVHRYAPGLAGSQVIAEPAGRNTAPAIALAAALLARDHGPDTVMAVLPADHYIAETEIFHRCLARAVQAAAAGWLATIGIRPTQPETGFGYLKTGESLAGLPPADDLPVFVVDRFVEKPDRETAVAYLADVTYLWNCGMFIWRVDTILAQVAIHLPDIAAALERFARNRERHGLDTALEHYYGEVESISIDYGIMEKAERVAVVPARMTWSDLGSWDALDELRVIPTAEWSSTVAWEACNNTVWSAKMTALVGVHDLLVVDTDDALLICRKGDSQRIREITAALKESGREELL
ncbi:MAG: NTP transferase domain-containing protein [Deltaproteobacteria bacterium]|nr:NTP transferase domain-containing protein [Candidatus Anaeroferrophillacea bacterium]